jgi:hypothetical protein
MSEDLAGIRTPEARPVAVALVRDQRYRDGTVGMPHGGPHVR